MKAEHVWWLVAVLVSAPALAPAENIDPYETGAQYAWAENVGWLNFEPAQGPGVQASADRLVGFVWGENIGWVNLSCETTDYCGAVDFGVVNDGLGNLSGFAWGENVGWINFAPHVGDDGYGVTIDGDGRFAGWAWGENIGWIRFDAAQAYNVRACKVGLDDLATMASQWLSLGLWPADLDLSGRVGVTDFARLAALWMDYCPDAWPLK